MNKTEQLNTLFQKWKMSYSNFAEDGIINEDLWNVAKRKVLVVLKETNAFSGDLRRLINKSPWKTLGYYNHCIQNVTCDHIPDFVSAEKEFESYCRMAAVLNLKKSFGGSSAKYDEIKSIAVTDKQMIQTQIRIIEPDVLICGGTFSICSEIFGNKQTIGERVYEFHIFPSIVFIDFYHPTQINIRHDMLYYTLAVYFQKYLQSKRCIT